MKFEFEKSLTKKTMNRTQAFFLPVRIKDGKVADWSEAYALLDESEKRMVGAYANTHKFKDGEGKLLYINGMPEYVFIAAATAFDKKKISLAVRQFVRVAKAEGIRRLGVYLDDFEEDGVAAETVAGVVAENALMAHFDFSEEFKTKPKEDWRFVETFLLYTLNEGRGIEEAVERGEIFGNAVNQCRTIANYPASDMTPEGVAEAAKTALKGIKNVSVTVLDDKRLKSEGMNAILAVGKGSAAAPRLVIMEYNGGKKGEKPLAFIGKGVTFDSGGLNIKRSESMMDMHMDMSGGAGVIYALSVIAKLRLPVNIVGLVPAVENMPSGLSYRQSDIIKTYGGKTIEIGNTDAEGRVILADAIEYAKTKNPAAIITLATLTGAVLVALGTRMSGLFVKNNHKLQDFVEKLGTETGDYVWPLPLWDEFEKDCQGINADVMNDNKSHPRGDASTAAAFLHYFAKPLPFVHIDMASRMTTNPDEEWLSKGAAGFGVRLLAEIANQYSAIKKLLV